MDHNPLPVAPPLRQLQWPCALSVDLAAEFPWLLLHEDASSELQRQSADHEDTHELSPTTLPSTQPHDALFSPYRQRLRAPKKPPPSLSPAQRAAMKMLKLQEALDQRDNMARCVAERAVREAEREAAAMTTRKPIHSSIQRPLPKKLTIELKMKKTRQVETPQAKLQQWLARQHDEPTVHIAELLSREITSRIEYKLDATLGSGLWADEVASPLAAELSSESIFGGLVPTRRLKFMPPSTTSEPLLESSQSLSLRSPVHAPAAVELFAADVKHEARAHAAQGDVREALATLQRGLERVLEDFQDDHDELVERGFDFSALAHAMASKLQRRYRARHSKRVASLVRVQRAWRRSRVRRAFLRQRALLSLAAARVQRAFRRHARERRAVMIQRFFRVFCSQRRVVAWWRLVRLAQAALATRRRLARRLRVVARLLRVLRARREAASRLQRLVRRRQARRQLASALLAAEKRERARGDEEAAVVARGVESARAALAAFYGATRRGRELQSHWWRWQVTNAREQLQEEETVFGERHGGPGWWRTVLRWWRRRRVGSWFRFRFRFSFRFWFQVAIPPTTRLLDQHERVLRSALRRVFRVVGGDPPKYECAWCNEGLATARMFSAHRVDCAEQERRAEQEREQLARDLVARERNRFVCRFVTRWTRRLQNWIGNWIGNRNKNRNRNRPTISTDPLERVAQSCRDRAALHALVAVAEACGTVLDGTVLLPHEFLTLLLSLVDAERGHPLERLHAATRTPQTWPRTHNPPEGWLALDHVRRSLGLSPRPPPKPSLWTRLRTWSGRRRGAPDARVLAAA